MPSWCELTAGIPLRALVGICKRFDQTQKEVMEPDGCAGIPRLLQNHRGACDTSGCSAFTSCSATPRRGLLIDRAASARDTPCHPSLRLHCERPRGSAPLQLD